ncbi:MAG: MoaD/ThiS family protein [Actinobacteria bacterium]|nr:MAG: MoaD/ThiS family protein [Actinomycetota bacterium]
MSLIRIPPMLRGEVGGARQVPADGDTVRELLDDLMARFPGLRPQLVEDDDIAPFVNVYVEGEDVRTLDGLDTSVDHGSTVILLPAMAGGL